MTQTNEVDRILEAMERQFMRPRFTDSIEWLEIDGTEGITFIPSDIISSVDWATLTNEDSDEETLHRIAQGWYNGKVWEVSTTKGFGARLSAPGYMDATDWTVFSTLDEAKSHLVEMYGDDIELDEKLDEA